MEGAHNRCVLVPEAYCNLLNKLTLFITGKLLTVRPHLRLALQVLEEETAGCLEYNVALECGNALVLWCDIVAARGVERRPIVWVLRVQLP